MAGESSETLTIPPERPIFPAVTGWNGLFRRDLSTNIRPWCLCSLGGLTIMAGKVVSSDRVVSLGVYGSPILQWKNGCVKGLVGYQN
jgi:hypothetical protein